MSQPTLDGFICVPKIAPAPATDTPTLPATPTAPVAPPSVNAKRAPRLHAAGVSTVLKLVEVARGHDERTHVALVTLSWRHRDACGADRIVVANEPRGAAFDLRPPPKAKKGASQEPLSTMSTEELCGLVDVGEMVAHMLLEDARIRVVVMDGFPKGDVYARFVVAIAARCLKLCRRAKDVPLRALTPNDPTCKEALARFKRSRSVEAMRVAAIDYYNDELADRFP